MLSAQSAYHKVNLYIFANTLLHFVHLLRLFGLSMLWFYEYWETTFTAEMKGFMDAIAEQRAPNAVGLMDGY